MTMIWLSSYHRLMVNWISTICNLKNNELGCWNPLSARQMYLSVLPDFLEPFATRVKKVVTSCSPDKHDYRGMMLYGPHNRLAFCSPTTKTATDFTGISSDNDKSDDDEYHRGGYQDIVYSTKHKLFFSIHKSMDFEAWNFPEIFQMDPPSNINKENYPWPKEEMELKSLCNSFTFLVVEEEYSGDIFWVRRHVLPSMAPDGSYAGGDKDDHPYKTIGFDVHKYDEEKCELVYMDGSLDGLAFFIGKSQSLALCAHEFPELKPNSIYFTDGELMPVWWEPCNPFGGHDVGIFNYEDRTFSPCYYPCDRESIQSIIPPPIWFTPNPSL